MSNYNFRAFTNPSGAKPGHAPELFFAPTTAFATDGIKEPVAPFTNVGDSLRVTATHEFLTDEGFIKLITYRDGLENNGKSSGDPGFKTGMGYTITGFLVGDEAELREYVDNVLNVGGIIIFKDPECNSTRYLQLGCECEPAIVEEDPEYTSGGRYSGGKKGFKINFSSKCLFDYTGTIEEKPVASS